MRVCTGCPNRRVKCVSRNNWSLRIEGREFGDMYPCPDVVALGILHPYIGTSSILN